MRNTGKYMVFASMLLLLPVVPGVSTIQPNYCNLYGSVYIEDNPKEADYRIFVEESEGLADVWIYKTDDKLFADRPGLWYITNVKAFADYVIYIDENRSLADFSVYYIDVESFAGCND